MNPTIIWTRLANRAVGLRKPPLLRSLALSTLAVCAAAIPTPTLTLSTNSLTFSQTNVGQQSSAQTITVTNPGVNSVSVAITITNAVTYVNPTGAQFTESDNCGSSLAAGASCSVNVYYTPSLPGTQNATLSFGSAVSTTVTLSGTSTALGNSDILMNIDQPNSTTPVAGTFTASGWAIDNGGAISSVLYLVDPSSTNFNSYAAAIYGYSRPDVCQAYPGRYGCPNVGWAVSIDTTALPNGSHSLYIKAMTVTGETKTINVQFTVSNSISASSSQLHVDQPSAGSSTLSGTTTVSGWAIAATGASAINTVNISVDGVPTATAVVNQSRGDVCVVYPGRPNCPNVGWSYQLDTTQLADGPHMLQFQATAYNYASNDNTYDYNVLQNLTAIVPVTVSNFGASQNNPIKIFIDSPTANSTVSGSATLSGWAIAGTTYSISTVSISVDGIQQQGTASYGVNRADVCVLYPLQGGCPLVGWSYSLDTTKLSDGVHRLSVTALSTSGQSGTVQTNFTVKNAGSNTAAFHAFVDYPAANSTLTGAAVISGWAEVDNAAVTSVALSLDGAPLGMASYGTISRPDICAAYPLGSGCPNAPNFGWNYSFNTLGLVDGTHTLDVTVTSGSQNVTFTRSFTSANSGAVKSTLLFIDQPNAGSAALSGTATVSGWAVDDYAQLSASALSVLIDGISVGQVTSYGTARADVCNAYPGRISCPNVGWTYSLDTTTLANGSHTLTIIANGSSQQTVSTSFSVSNSSTAFTSQKISIDTPVLSGPPLQGIVPVSGWAIATNSATVYVQLELDGIPAAQYLQTATPRADVCTIYPTALDCPNAGWSINFDSTQYPDGKHTLTAMLFASGGTALASVPITISNSGTLNPMHMNIDYSGTASLSGTVTFAGWAVSDNAPISTVAISVDGTSQGNATYGVSRGDVCAIYVNRAGCPNVGWQISVNTTKLSNGTHTLTATSTSSLGNQATQTASFTVKN